MCKLASRASMGRFPFLVCHALYTTQCGTPTRVATVVRGAEAKPEHHTDAAITRREASRLRGVERSDIPHYYNQPARKEVLARTREPQLPLLDGVWCANGTDTKLQDGRPG